MKVTDAIHARKSVRAFTDETVSDETIRELLDLAARAPSGGNVQPWRIYVIGADTMPAFRSYMSERSPEPPEYDVYPPKLWDPYRTNRFALGEAMYETMGIARDDKAARFAHLARNFEFFGAPAALFCFIDRGMGPPQWSDLGMFLQTFMLGAAERGLATCPQEAWASYPKAVAEFVAAPDEEMLFCGVAIGHEDTTAPVNSLVSERVPVDEFTTFVTR